MKEKRRGVEIVGDRPSARPRKAAQIKPGTGGGQSAGCITSDELDAELERIMNRDDEGETVAEMAGNTGWSTRRVRKGLQELARQGKLKIGSRRATNIRGHAIRQTVYRIVGGTKKA